MFFLILTPTHAAIGGPVFVISLFWLAFAAKEDVHYIVSSMAGLGFGTGFVLIFIGMLNYLTDAYEIFAASANAAASSARSLVAVILPLATAPMFRNLGISGALRLLGGLSLLLSISRGSSCGKESEFEQDPHFVSR